MKSKCLVIVDVQNDFVSGALGTEEAQQILPKVIKRQKAFRERLSLLWILMEKIIWRLRRAGFFR